MLQTVKTSGYVLTGYKAKYYDLGNFFYGVSLVNRKHVSLINLSQGDSLLDVGCGTAEVIYQLVKRFSNGVSLHGVDPSKEIIEVARNKLQAYPYIKVEIGIGEKLSFKDNSFDWVISCLTTHHLPMKEKLTMIHECHRVLKPGGRLLITDFGKPTHILGKIMALVWRNHSYARENMKNVIADMVQETGFRDINITMQAGLIQHITASK